jgi:hypothetical protein
MDRVAMRAYRPMIGDVFELKSIPIQVKYISQSNIRVGVKLYVVEDDAKMMISEYVCHYRKMPKLAFIITGVVYKSVLSKYFRWFLKYPIKSILVKCIG